MEKDFWVCWLLGILFESEFAGNLVFKGGTSLSKVFGVIERFSEDIDLSLSPEFLRLPDAGTSRNQANKWMKTSRGRLRRTPCEIRSVQRWKRLQQECSGKGAARMVRVPDRSGHELAGAPLSLPIDRSPPGFEYLKRSVKLEFGSLTDQQPVGRHPVRPWLADVFPAAFPDWRCEVVALEVERSFWEKATILHTEYHRPAGKPTPDRFSRHYADTAALAKHPAASKAIDLMTFANES